jgi:hypothetical protein
MTDLVGALVAVAFAVVAVVLLVLAVTGRAKVRSCCAVPAEHDLRLRDASRTGEIV